MGWRWDYDSVECHINRKDVYGKQVATQRRKGGRGSRTKKNMAFIERSMASDGKRVMSLEEFKRWLRRFDSNGDGRISCSELREAVRLSRGRFASWKSKRGVKAADTNRNGFIDDNEFRNLTHFADKYLNIRITD
ncbi:probable calcium-binding protein CML23 [Neltuma alba]|uniref:probable calcium-binding protein CML23 n=1 Tax=Neltuma alba TaxID=207710 RepID=UPI0010A4C4D5|nr:probable calcium-binding protein CML23 [Prosopis alba]